MSLCNDPSGTARFSSASREGSSRRSTAELNNISQRFDSHDPLQGPLNASVMVPPPSANFVVAQPVPSQVTGSFHGLSEYDSWLAHNPMRSDTDFLKRSNAEEVSIRRVGLLEREVQLLRNQLAQVTEGLRYTRQRLEKLETQMRGRSSADAIPISVHSGDVPLPKPSTPFTDVHSFGHMAVPVSSESPAWRRRLSEERLITKDDLKCYKKASIQRAIYLAQVGHEEMAPILEIFAIKGFAGRSKSKSTLYRIRNMLTLFNSVFQGRFEYIDEFVKSMGKGADCDAESGSWCELGDFYSKDSVRELFKDQRWPGCKELFLKEWNRFRRQRTRQRPPAESVA